MYFKVLSRSNAKRISYKKMSSPCVIISITMQISRTTFLKRTVIARLQLASPMMT